jgi:hypothetical protein
VTFAGPSGSPPVTQCENAIRIFNGFSFFCASLAAFFIAADSAL